MTVAYPWSGRDVGGRVPLSGRAAVPVPSGAGFNWASIIRHTSGMHGLGQSDGTSTTVLGAPWSTLGIPTDSSSTAASASTAPWYASLIAAGLQTGQTIANFELNPLYQKGTYYQTPQGAIYATNTGAAVPGGLTTATGSLLPILLLGGGLMLFMFMARR